jgi:aconitate hydratase
MGVLPLQFKENDSVEKLGITGDETYEILGMDSLKPQQDMILVVTAKDGKKRKVTLLSRIDTSIEVDYFKHGGILPYVLRELLDAA